MFTPEYLNELVESTNTAATDFSLYLSNKVIDSVVNLFEQHGEIKIIPSNVQRLKLLNEQSGILVADIEKEIRKRLPGLEKKIREAFLQFGYEINEDINKSVADMVESDKELKDFIGKAPRLEHLTESEEKLLDAAYRRTRGEIRNLTCTTAADLNQQFVKSCDSAWWKATHGVDRNTAIREAIDEVSRYGTHVIYKSKNGKVRKMTVEAATRMCVLTGINQANAEITLSHCVDMGMRTVLVSSHIGARYTDYDEPANHMSWQGKVYSLSDKLLKEYGYEEKKKNVFGKIKEFFQNFRKQQEFEDFETVTGYGTIEGLCGVNCRHTFHPFDPKGNSNPYKDYDNEENKRKYDLFQKQRAMERKIRETKKRLYNIRHAIKTLSDENAIAEMKLGELEAKTLFDKQFGEYEVFCERNGLGRSEDRLYIGSTKQTVPERNIDADIFHVKKVKDFTKTANEINVELDSICTRESKWSGKIIIDSKINGLGSKEWNCDIRLKADAGYDTELHELLHARSGSYYDEKTYAQHLKMEEGTVELLTEEICKRKKVDFVLAYKEETKYLRRINRRAKLYKDEYSFAVDVLNVPLIERKEWLIKKINDNYNVGLINYAERNGAFDSLAKIIEEVR